MLFRKSAGSDLRSGDNEYSQDRSAIVCYPAHLYVVFLSEPRDIAVRPAATIMYMLYTDLV